MVLVAPSFATDVDFINIHFQGSLFDVTYSLYGRPIYSLWMQGTIISLNYDQGVFDFDDGTGRILQIKLMHSNMNSENVAKYTVKCHMGSQVGQLVSIVCGLSHIIMKNDALLCLKLLRISSSQYFHRDYWNYMVKIWRLEAHN
ncbi:uncharacterized protein BBOV_IV008005 [Babesia bovis T2Bo]|uniref:uncharacterized protein n=1 Tax=Babesia bovis T2Bo TaxID=484906 RepID=UPI001DDD68FF|nr:uncharacterized protein BBOV_IV008005 [Babesia bovis T2Bo]KAG6439944.1 hypothetical protein BBOV_IV008005 [Babesia bovis T2Bo]